MAVGPELTVLNFAFHHTASRPAPANAVCVATPLRPPLEAHFSPPAGLFVVIAITAAFIARVWAMNLIANWSKSHDRRNESRSASCDDELDAVNGYSQYYGTHRYVYPVGVIFGAASFGPTFLPPAPAET
jgi:hypothetical protein